MGERKELGPLPVHQSGGNTCPVFVGEASGATGKLDDPQESPCYVK